MITTKTRRKIVIKKVEILDFESFRMIEIKLPANVRKVTGVLVTASGNVDTFGTITFQANDKSDLFFKMLLQRNDNEPPDESFIGIEDPQFQSHLNWVTGKVPDFHPVMVAGDSGIIHAWFQPAEVGIACTITIYIECEMAEELVEVDADEEIIGEDKKSDLDPVEIHL